MSKKIKMIAIPLLVISVFSIGIYATSSHKGKIVDKVEANVISPDESAKQAIQDKMLNSTDYFKSAKGSSRYYIKKSNLDETIEFDVKLNGNPSSYEKVTNNLDQTSIETTFDGENRLNVNHKDKMYTLAPVLKADPNASKPPKSAQARSVKDANGKIIGGMVVRDPAAMGMANSVLNNQNIALILLGDHDKWKIQGDDVFLGLPATVIIGEVPDIYKPRFDATSFKLWVHKDTGIILNLEMYNTSGDVVLNFKLNDIKLNSDTMADDEKFKIKTPQNYKEVKAEPQK